MKKMQKAMYATMGFLACLTIMITTPALAKTATETLQATYNNIKLVVDGNPVATANEPFIVDGTTYLPVRAVAEALGKDVEWDGTTNTVIIGSVAIKTPLVKATVLRGSMYDASTDNRWNTDSYNNTYYSATHIGSGGNFVIDVSKYSKLSGTLACSDISSENGTTVQFYSVDESGKTTLIEETKEITPLTNPFDFSVDLTGVNILMINGVGGAYASATIGDAYLE